MLELVAMLSLEMKRNKRLWASESVRWACVFTRKGTLRKGITTSCVGIATIMKCSLGNNHLYGSNSERLSLLEITGKHSRISFDDVRTDIPFTLLFFLLLKIFILFYVKNLHGPAKNSVATVLPAELRLLPTSTTKI